MTIQGIGGATAAYQAVSQRAKTTSTSTSTGSTEEKIPAGASSPSTIVTLSNGAQSNVKAVGGALVGTPLSIAWAPETFVQGDTNEDENLDVGEFSEQLKRIGVTSEDAQKLFSSFDTSSDGKLSIFEFVDGVTQSIKNGEKQFTDLVNSYTQDKSGHFDQVATKDFLDKGAALAAKYEKAAGIGR